MMVEPTNFIEMVEQERYDWDMISTTILTREEHRRMRDLYPWDFRRKEFEHICIVQWLYYDEEHYRNWIYDLDLKKESQTE